MMACVQMVPPLRARPANLNKTSTDEHRQNISVPSRPRKFVSGPQTDATAWTPEIALAACVGAAPGGGGGGAWSVSDPEVSHTLSKWIHKAEAVVEGAATRPVTLRKRGRGDNDDESCTGGHIGMQPLCAFTCPNPLCVKKHDSEESDGAGACVVDVAAGDIVCPSCGWVAVSHMLTDGPERCYTCNDDKSAEDDAPSFAATFPSRYEYLLTDSSTLGRQQKNAKDAAILEAIKVLDTAVFRLGFPQSVVDIAVRMYAVLRQKDVMCAQRVVVCAACLFVARCFVARRTPVPVALPRASWPCTVCAESFPSPLAVIRHRDKSAVCLAAYRASLKPDTGTQDYPFAVEEQDAVFSTG